MNDMVSRLRARSDGLKARGHATRAALHDEAADEIVSLRAQLQAAEKDCNDYKTGWSKCVEQLDTHYAKAATAEETNCSLTIALSEMRRDRDKHSAASRQWQADARRAQAEAIEAGLVIEKLYAALEPFSEVAGSLFIANANANDIIVKTSSIALRFSAFLDARRAYISATEPKK